MVSKKKKMTIISQSHTTLAAAFPSSAAFDAISEAIATDKDRKDAVKQGGAIFAFNLKNAEQKEQAWYIDLKETGRVGKGAAPEGKKADGESSSLFAAINPFARSC